MNLKNIRTFVTAAERNSFTAAAVELHYAQSTVTAQIDALERELGVKLFIRSGKNISLSDAGRTFLGYAYRMLSLQNDVESYFRGEERISGTVRLGIIESVSASDYVTAVASFLQENPEVDIRMLVGTTLELTEKLKKGEVDLVFLLDQPVQDPDLSVLARAEADVLFFAASDHDVPAETSLARLQDETWILTEPGCNYRRILDDRLTALNLTVRNNLEAGVTGMIIDFVSRDIGISLLPVFNLKTALEQKQVRTFDVTDCRIRMELQVLANRHHWLSPAMRRLAESLKDAISKPL